MKGAATSVSIRQVEAAHPHLTRLLIDSARRVRLRGHEGRLYPILPAARPLRGARYDRGLCLTRKYGSGEDEQQIEILSKSKALRV